MTDSMRFPAEQARLAYALNAATAEVVRNCEEKGWYDEPRTFGEDIALLHSEVSEALEAYRDYGYVDATARIVPGCTDETVYEGGLCQHGKPLGECIAGAQLPKPEGVGSELADVFIRLLDTCHRRDVDLAAEFERKVAYNATRPYRHGNKVL